MIEINPDYKSYFADLTEFDDFYNLPGKVYRDVAGRRTVQFEKNGKRFFIKCHAGVGWREIIKNLCYLRLPVVGARTEYDAIKAFQKASIATVTPVAYAEQGYSPASKRSFLITEDLGDITTLEQYCLDWAHQPMPLKQRRDLIKKVALLTRRLHDHGMNHRDLYLCHYVFTDADKTQLALMDLHRVQRRRTLPLRWQIKDLAGLYFSTMGLGLSQHDYLYFWRCYIRHPITRIDIEFWQQVIKRAHKIYRRDQLKLAKRKGVTKHNLFNNSDQVIKQQTWRSRLLCRRDQYSEEMQSLIDNIDALFEQNQVVVLKKDLGTELIKVELNGKPVVIKRYNVKGMWHYLRRCWRQTRAAKGWYFAHMLLAMGIRTAAPIAMLEKRFGPLRGRCYLIQEFVSDQHLLAHVTQNGFEHKSSQILIKRSQHVLDKLATLGISHGDTKATNILLRDGKSVLIDLDGMRWTKFAWRGQKLVEKDQKRFDKNWQQLKVES